MNKTLTALLLALTSAWAVDQNPVVEMYPDDMPKSHLVWKKKAPQACYLTDKEYLGIEINSVIEHLHHVFKLKGFENMDLDPTYWMNNKITRYNFLFGQVDEKSLSSEFIFLNLNLKQASLDPILEQIPCKIHDSVLQKDKWNYPRKVFDWDGKYEDINEMSWKYIDCILHSKPNIDYMNQYFSTNLVEKKLYQIVREKGLVHTVTRAIFVFSNDDIFGCSLIYDTEKEKKTREEILLKFKSSF